MRYLRATSGARATVNPEYTDVDAVDHEEQETLIENVADYLQSIID